MLPYAMISSLSHHPAQPQLIKNTNKIKGFIAMAADPVIQRKGQLIDQAAVRRNTRKATEYACRSYENTMGKALPCTTEELLNYLAVVFDQHREATINNRCYLIGSWHRDNGYPNPAKDPRVTKRLKGVRALTHTPQTQAQSLAVEDLESCVLALEHTVTEESAATALDPRKRRARQLQAIRDKAFLLLGFWFGLRSDNLIRLRAEHVTIERRANGARLSLYLASTKTTAKGETRHIEALPYLCPVAAVSDWVDAALLHDTEGYLFTGINQWGQIRTDPLHRNSVNRMLRTVLTAAGLDAARFSSHSLRRGLANWIKGQGGTLKDAMEWVRWKDVRSAQRYEDTVESLPSALMTGPSSIHTALGDLRLLLSRACSEGRIASGERDSLLDALNTLEKLAAPTPPLPALAP